MPGAKSILYWLVQHSQRLGWRVRLSRNIM